MLILNEEGWTVWTLPHETVTLMNHYGGDVARPEFPKDPDELAAFLDRISASRVDEAACEPHGKDTNGVREALTLGLKRNRHLITRR